MGTTTGRKSRWPCWNLKAASSRQGWRRILGREQFEGGRSLLSSSRNPWGKLQPEPCRRRQDCCRWQLWTTQSLVSWGRDFTFYMKCSEKPAMDLTVWCLDMWFPGCWIKITPSLVVKRDMERQEKRQEAKRGCISATWWNQERSCRVPFRQERMHRWGTDGVSPCSLFCLRESTFLHSINCGGAW